ncbi:MAG: hypothetical protein KA369_01115 [Spirochaetes bacterium]|nr:hypothetical protein [Spirochaetota bacterium]
MDDRPRQIPVSECRICKNLKDLETSFVKFGWDEGNMYLPDAAKELVPAQDLRAPGCENHHVKQCPLCGRLYRYDMTHDYYINGSEDEETLRRLTPEEIRLFLLSRKEP